MGQDSWVESSIPTLWAELLLTPLQLPDSLLMAESLSVRSVPVFRVSYLVIEMFKQSVNIRTAVHPVIATRWAGNLGRKSKKLIMIMVCYIAE